MFNYSRMLLLVMFMMLGSMIVSAQADQIPPLAAVTDRQLTLYNINGGSQTILRAEVLPFDNIVWSPDGQKLAFTHYDGSYSPRLMLSDRNGSAPSMLADSVYVLPASFSTDSSLIYYTLPPASDSMEQGSGGLPTFAVDIVAQAPTAGAERQTVGQIRFGTGCGGGSPFPMDAVYNIETGFGGSDVIFTHTTAGIVYSNNCAGRGLSLIDLNSGAITELGAGLRGASVSPDRSQVAALENGQIIVIDLNSQQRRSYAPQYSPDQVDWGENNNTLYYSVRSLVSEPLPLAENEAQAFANWFGRADASIPQYHVSIQRVDLGGGSETRIYDKPAWAVGRMFTSGGSLYFTLVPNGESWVEAVAAGSINLSSPDGIFQERRTVAVTLVRVPVNGGVAVELASDIGQPVLHPSAR